MTLRRRLPAEGLGALLLTAAVPGFIGAQFAGALIGLYLASCLFDRRTVPAASACR